MRTDDSAGRHHATSGRVVPTFGDALMFDVAVAVMVNPAEYEP